MSLVLRYFKTAATGAGDGTTVADAAALFTAGAWSTVLTGFAFSGSDALECRILAGTHTITVALATGLFANPPSTANPLWSHGADAAGARLAVPDPDWTADMPTWDANTFPILATTTNIATLSLANMHARCLKLTASGRQAAMIALLTNINWLSLENSTANTSASCVDNDVLRVANVSAKCSGTAYSTILRMNNSSMLSNIRCEGNPSATTGTRSGIQAGGTTSIRNIERACVFNNPGPGIDGSANTNVAAQIQIRQSVIANNGASGILLPSTASQTNYHVLTNNMLTGNGAYGVDAQSAARTVLFGNRTRDNVTAGTNGLGNFPDDSYTTDSDDATEYVNAAAGDFRIKSGATIHGMGFGVSQQAASGGISQGLHPIESGIAT